AALAALANSGSPAPRPTQSPRPTRQEARAPRDVQAHATGTRHAAHKQTLTLAQLAGQRIVYAYAGLQPPHSLLSLIRAGEAAGVILFSNNIVSVPQISAV